MIWRVDRSSRSTGNRGQASTAYLGVLILVAAIVGALTTTGLGGRISGGIEQAVCQVVSLGGDEDCGGSSQADGDGDGDDPEEDAPTPRERAEAGDYVAIGDSFSSGEGAYDYDPETDTGDNACHRSDNAYPELIADEFDFEGETINVTCSGARTGNVEESGQYGEGPQLDAITDDTSLVTIGVGGNDAEWTDVIIDCLSDIGSGCQDSEADVRQNMEAAADAVLSVYQQAVELAPDDARIIGIGYPRFFPDPPDGDLFGINILCVDPPFVAERCAKRLGLSEAEQAWMNDMFREFNDMLAERAEEAGIEFVDMYDAFDGHEYGTDDPYMNDLVLDWPDWDDCGLSKDEIVSCLQSAVQSETAHPNAAGQAAMAELIREQIENP